MSSPLHVLILEDRSTDAELMLRELRLAGFDPHWQRVETESDYLAHLDNAPHVILADYHLPQFNAERALHLLKERGADIPFIIVSGCIGEEVAVECMKNGAADYLLKDRLARLGPAVTHALAQKRLREEKQSAVDALWESQRTLLTLISNLPGMVYRRLHEPSWAFTYASEGCFPLTGYQSSEFIDKRLDYAQVIHPDDLQCVLNEVEAAIHNGRPFQLIYRIRSATGEEKWVWERGRGVTSLEEQPLLVEGFITDITERKRAEMALAQLSHQYRLILSSAGEGIYGLDLEGNTTFVNPAAARMIGYEVDELIGKPQHTILHHSKPDGSPYPREDCPIYAAFKDGTVHHVETEVFWRKDGTSFPVAYTSTPIRDENGELVGAVVTFRDISEQKLLQEQLHQAARMEAIGQLAGGVAHDFNNLLTVISTYSQLLLLRTSLEEPFHGYVEEIGLAGQRAASLTRQLLAFSRKQFVQPRELDVNALVTNLTKMLERLIGEHIELTTFLAPSLGMVKIDPGQLEQTIVNLVVNARDAMPEGGKITIETANVEKIHTDSLGHGQLHPSHAVRLSVRDSGHGMDAETRSRIFEPFFTTKEPGKGTGMGLSTAYGIVTQNDGTIEVDSTPGQGTTFRITLPRIEETQQTVDRPPIAVPLSSGTETVLVVEDEGILRKVVRDVLVAAGYQVLEAANGKEAQELCASHAAPIHLLLTDVVMPGINGQMLAEGMSLLRPGIRVLFMSGYMDDMVFQHGVQEGTTALLQKPFTADSLTHAVRQVLTT